MKRHFNLFLLNAAALLSLSACTTHIADFSAISTRDVAPGRIDLTKLEQKQVTGVDSEYSIFFPLGLYVAKPYTPIYGPFKVDNAVEDALRKGNGDLLLDATLQIKIEFYLLMVRQSYVIKGTVVNTHTHQSNG